MPKYAYLREDGRYDVFDVEPTTLTAAEYAAVKKREELAARKAQLLVERSAIDAALADIDKQTAELNKASVEPTKESSAAALSTDTSGKRKW